MIRQSEGSAAVLEIKSEDGVEKSHVNKDSALWAPTGWVHVEKDIDFSDPKVTLLLFRFLYFLLNYLIL